MSLLFSNFPPLQTERDSYSKAFKALLGESDVLNIATGYISTDSIVDLTSILVANHRPHLNLLIGMHYFEGVSPAQKQAIDSLAQVLRDQSLGNIYFSVVFPFHGKIATFQKVHSLLGGLIGSSNLSNIINGGPRQYEADYLFGRDQAETLELDEFISKLIEKGGKPYSETELTIHEPHNNLLNDQYGVEAVSEQEMQKLKTQLSALSFALPLKADEAPGSNINKHFGKGRKNVQGFVIPRSWYEVELIVPKSITSVHGYPQSDSYGDAGLFLVFTDDGWKFACKVSGTNSKNICSDGDMKILGKWLKGRLENKGILKPGERVTDKMLKEYGRSNITMTKVNDGGNLWYLDFGVSK